MSLAVPVVKAISDTHYLESLEETLFSRIKHNRPHSVLHFANDVLTLLATATIKVAIDYFSTTEHNRIAIRQLHDQVQFNFL